MMMMMMMAVMPLVSPIFRYKNLDKLLSSHILLVSLTDVYFCCEVAQCPTLDCWGEFSVTVIVQGNEIVNLSSNLGRS